MSLQPVIERLMLSRPVSAKSNTMHSRIAVCKRLKSMIIAWTSDILRFGAVKNSSGYLWENTQKTSGAWHSSGANHSFRSKQKTHRFLLRLLTDYIPAGPPKRLAFFAAQALFWAVFLSVFFSRGQGVPFCKRVCCALRRDGAAGRFSLRPVWRNYERYGKKDPCCRVRQHQ